MIQKKNDVCKECKIKVKELNKCKEVVVWQVDEGIKKVETIVELQKEIRELKKQKIKEKMRKTNNG